jgi:hypothetical protein
MDYNLAMADPIYFRVEPHEIAKRKLVRVIRTTTPMPERSAEVRAAFASLLPRLTPYFGGRALLDLRLGPGRNDPEFEAATKALRVEILRRFERVAIVVRSAVGVLHVKRLSQGEGEIFLDEDEALRHLTQP